MTGEQLRDIRIAWRMTQKEMADLLGYHFQKISEFERDVKAIPEIIEKYVLLRKTVLEIKKMLEE